MKFFAQGRTALYYGLLKMQIKKENKILIPNYICKSLLTPIIKLNINYKFYNIKDDFTFNINEIKKKTAAKDYLLVVHYFGQPQNMNSILNFCKNPINSTKIVMYLAYFESVIRFILFALRYPVKNNPKRDKYVRKPLLRVK
jgi:hypothetical protein